MNEVLKCLEERRSCRSYKPDMIPEDVLNQILEAGTYAATGMGKQSPIMIAVTDQKVRDQLSAMNAKIMGVNIDPFYGAPAHECSAFSRYCQLLDPPCQGRI